MTRTRSTFFALLAFLLSPMTANAGPIAVGSLASNDDGSTDVITDNLNDREWLRWDQLSTATSAPTYQQMLSLVQPGGAYDGWSLATTTDTYLFLDALMSGAGGRTCSPNDAQGPIYYGYVCGTGIGSGLTQLFGDNYDPYWDIVWYLSESVANGVGVMRYNINTAGGTGTGGGTIYADDYWGTVSPIGNSDSTSSWTGTTNRPITFLMYRSTGSGPNPVPEPGTLALLGLGLVGMAVRRRKTV